jgi:hypothetical protein
VKVALLRDAGFYRYLETNVENIANGDLAVLTSLIRRSAELHLAHICGNGDPFELGSARPLDFGHWAAHKLESMTEHRLRHGEAVASRPGTRHRLFGETRAPGPHHCRADSSPAGRHRIPAVGSGPRGAGGGRRSSHCPRPSRIPGAPRWRTARHLLRDIGQGFEVTEMDEATVANAIDELEARCRERLRNTEPRVRSAVIFGRR